MPNPHSSPFTMVLQIADWVALFPVVNEKWKSDYKQFLLKKYLNLIEKKGLFLVEKWEIQVIISMIMLTRSSESIFNPMRYTGSYFRIWIGDEDNHNYWWSFSN